MGSSKTVRSAYGVVGCLLFRGCLSTEVNVRTVGTFGIVCYTMGVRCWGVSAKLYIHCNHSAANQFVSYSNSSMQKYKGNYPCTAIGWISKSYYISWYARNIVNSLSSINYLTIQLIFQALKAGVCIRCRIKTEFQEFITWKIQHPCLSQWKCIVDLWT